MRSIRSAGVCLVLFFAVVVTGCADKKIIPVTFTKLTEFSDSRGQANVKLYQYSGLVKKKDINSYIEKLGCKMLYAYFYPDFVPLNEIPVEEVRSAQSFNEVQEALYNEEGFASWRFYAQCFSVIPIVTDCKESRVSQNCR